MSENYIEQIVACKSPKGTGTVKVLLVVLCVLSCVLILIPYIGAFLIAGVIIVTILVFRSYNYEYEYTYVDGELDVDKIIARSRRKKMNSFDFKRLELVAPVGSQEALRLEHGKYKTFNYTSNMPDARVYAAYVMSNNEMVRLLFEPNDSMLKEISYISPRKVIM